METEAADRQGIMTYALKTPYIMYNHTRSSQPLYVRGTAAPIRMTLTAGQF